MRHVAPPAIGRPIATEPKMYTRVSFCAAHGIGETSFHKEVNEGRLVAVKFHGRTMVRQEDAEAWRQRLPRRAPRSTNEEPANGAL